MLLLLLVVFGVSTTKSTQFQTFLVKQYISSLAKKLNTTITVDNVEISFFNGVQFSGLYIEDLHRDTLLYIPKLNVEIDEFSVKEKRIILEQIALNEVYFNLKKYKTDSTLNIQFILDHYAPKDSTKGSKWQFGLDKLKLSGSRFNYVNDHQAVKSRGIDFNHLKINEIQLEADDFEFIPDGLNCVIKNLSLKEQKGFELNHLAAMFNISPKGIFTQGLRINSPNTFIDGNVSFITNSYASWANFSEEVQFKTYFNASELSDAELAFFVPDMECSDLSVGFMGEVNGRINKLKGKKMTIKLNNGTRFRGDFDLNGLPDIENTFFHLKIKELVTSAEQLRQIPLAPFCQHKRLELPQNLDNLGQINYKGSLTGFYYDLFSYGKIRTKLGEVETDLGFKIIDNLISYRGEFSTSGFELGELLQTKDQIGDIVARGKIDGKGVTLDELEASFIGNVKKININGYEYNYVQVKGDFAKQKFNGYLSLEDENLDFDFNGEIDLSNELPEFHFNSSIERANLVNLNLMDSSYQNPIISTNLRVNLIGDHIDNMVGSIVIDSLIYQDRVDTITVNSIIVDARKNGESKELIINSEIFEGSINGNYNFKELVGASKNNLVKFIPSMKEDNYEQVLLKNNFTFHLNIYDSELLSKLLLTDAQLAPNSVFEGFFNAENQSLKLAGNMPWLTTAGLKVNDLKVKAKTNERTLSVDFLSNKIEQNDSVYIQNFKLNNYVQEDSIHTELRWNNTDSVLHSSGEIYLSTYFHGLDHFDAKFYNSSAIIGDTLWTINENNLISYADTASTDSGSGPVLKIQSLGFKANDQNLLMDGKLSDSPDDQLDVALSNFNLTNLQKLIPDGIVEVEGITSGVASVKKENNEIIFTSDLSVKDLSINHTKVGSGEVKSSWKTNEKTLYIDAQFYKGHIPSIVLVGNYYPFKENESLEFNLELQRTDLRLIESYTEGFISNLRGVANADLKLTGTPEKPDFNGYVKLKKTGFKIDYLNTSYTTPNCQINLSPDMISFDNVQLFDEKAHSAYANGTIFHEYFKNLSIDVGLDVKEFFVLNTNEKDNSLYYGTAVVSGFVNVGGYQNQLNIDLDISTNKGTTINIPLSDNEDVVENDFIEFVTNDTTNTEAKEEVDLSNILMNFNLRATPDAEVRLVFDDQVGDVMKAKGEGDLNFVIDSYGEFNIYGEYKIKDGDYLFTLQNIINKRFDMAEGGKIVWNGTPYDAQLDLTAVYRLRARLYELLAGSEDSLTANIYKKRVPVNLKLRMTKSMLKPDIAFDIDLPTTDETTRGKVRSILYMSNQEENIQELNKQVFSLLVLNQFIPPYGQGGAAYSNVGATTSSELLSNQLSNWLSKISNDFDIGINYRPGDELSNQELELALSTQIFNDRLTLDGNFGVADNNSAYTGEQGTNNLIGDFSMEYKITEDGKLRVKAFNASNQTYLERSSSNFTQGVGLFYRKDFDNFSDLFRKGLKKKKTNN